MGGDYARHKRLESQRAYQNFPPRDTPRYKKKKKKKVKSLFQTINKIQFLSYLINKNQGIADWGGGVVL